MRQLKMIGFRKQEDTRDIFEKLYHDTSDGADTILNYYEGSIADAFFRAASEVSGPRPYG